MVFGILTDINTPSGCLARKHDLWKGNRGYKLCYPQGRVLFLPLQSEHCAFAEPNLLSGLLKNELHTEAEVGGLQLMILPMYR